MRPLVIAVTAVLAGVLLLAAPAGATTVTYTPTADTSVGSAAAVVPRASLSALKIDGSPVIRTLLRFKVDLPAGATVTGARLRLYTMTRRTRTGYRVSTLTGRRAKRWRESVTWRNAPHSGRLLARRGGWSVRGYKAATLPAGAVPRSGPASFAVETRGSAGKRFHSRENRKAPRLVVSYTKPTSGPAPPRPGSPPSAPVWSDEFGGAAGALPNPSMWSMKTGGRWVNGGTPELQCYTTRPENVSQNGLGQLRIAARYEPGSAYCSDASNDYTSARIDTRGLKSFQYGRIEARIQLPTAAGSWPAFWMVGSTGAWPSAGEIDILEYRHGPAPGVAHQAIHADMTTGEHWQQSTDVFGTWTAAWHTYGIDWTKDRIDFLIDGAIRWTVSPATLPAGARWRFNRSFGLLLNVAVGNWGGTPDPAQFPAEMLVDWVRVYQDGPQSR